MDETHTPQLDASSADLEKADPSKALTTDASTPNKSSDEPMKKKKES